MIISRHSRYASAVPEKMTSNLHKFNDNYKFQAVSVSFCQVGRRSQGQHPLLCTNDRKDDFKNAGYKRNDHRGYS